MKYSIRLKLILLGVGCVLVSVAVMIGVSIWQTRVSSEKSISQVNELIDAEIEQIAVDVYNLIRSQDEAIQLQVVGGLNVLKYLIDHDGGLSLGEIDENWTVVNQITSESKQVQLPQLLLGENWLRKVTDPSVSVPAVDELMEQLDAKATIFQPLPDGSGILRVATNVTSVDGKRAIGTYIPAKNADGSDNVVVSTVMSGKQYQGVAFVVDAWYVTAYHPVMNSAGEVIAVLFVGIKQESVATLRNAIMQTEVGKSGYINIIGGAGAQQGVNIISRGGEQDGVSVWEDKDVNGKLIYQEIVNTSLALPPEQTATFKFQTSHDTSERVARVAYYTPWDWVIIVNGYQGDYQSFYDDLEKSQTQMVLMFLLFGLGLSIISFILVFFIARSMTNPIVNMTNTANQLAEGDIDQVITYRGNDEIGILADAFRKMIAYLKNMSSAANSLSNKDFSIDIAPQSERDTFGISFSQMVESLRETIGKVALSAESLDDAAVKLSRVAQEVNDATNQIASTIQQVAKGTQEQTSAVTRTASSVEQMTMAIEGVAKGAQEQSEAVSKAAEITDQISNTIEQVAGNAAAVTDATSISAESARKGAETVEHTLEGMQSIKAKVGISAEKVQEMGRRSAEIGEIVATIEDIASQTNLLALNAAIEAARAGEHGKGFAVVAEEVRKLAERSTLATKEIGNLVNGILSTVTEAVRAMEEGSNEVELGVESANLAGEALSEILTATEDVGRQAAMAAEASNRMRNASIDLVNAVNSVSAVVEENTASTEEMSANSSEVSQSIEQIASVSEENSAAVEEVSASAEQMSAQMGDVNKAVVSLTDMANNLKVIVAQFKFRKE